MRRVSISLRLTAWYAGISAVGLAVFGVVMWFVLANSMLSWKDRTMLTRAQRTEAVLRAGNGSDAPTLESKLEAVVSVLPEGEWIQVVGVDGRRLFPTQRLPAISALLPGCAEAAYRDQKLGRERFRELCHPVRFAGEPASLFVLSPLSEDRILLSNFTSGLYRMIPILMLVSGLGGYVLSRRALAPVDVVIAEARAITAEDLSRRLTVSSTDDQLRRLAVEWNDLLARIERAMIRVTQFTADASHELRSPISFIKATAEYHLATPALEEEIRDAFRAIFDESAAAGAMLEGLLMLARLDAGQIVPSAEDVDVSEVLSDLVFYFQPLMQKHAHRFEVDAGAAGYSLRMNASHLRRVLIAVVDNAAKYTPDGGTIRVDCRREADLTIRITDTGVGIAPQHVDRIFDRFFRVDAARTTTTEGIGLGLSIAKRLMEEYGCTLVVKSEMGSGTTMTLRFPSSIVGGVPGAL